MVKLVDRNRALKLRFSEEVTGPETDQNGGDKSSCRGHGTTIARGESRSQANFSFIFEVF